MSLFITKSVGIFTPAHVRTIYNRCRIGNRDWVGFGHNGSANYQDDPLFPFPAVRFKENTRDICALREKEKGDWKCLCCEEKKALYRASFCQTFSEFQHPTGLWKVVLGGILLGTSFTFWVFMFNHHFVFEPLPASFSKESQKAQLRRMLELRVDPINGLCSKWDYFNDRWYPGCEPCAPAGGHLFAADAAGRRTVFRQELYEGIPIEFPVNSRRQLENNELEQDTTTTPDTTTTTTTHRIQPPMDRRYRRIYNPDETATVEVYPFMAAVLVNGELWCGGVVIARDSVLTAAHCLQLQYNNRFFREYVKMLTVRVGSSNATAGGDLLRVSEIYFHPNYKPQTLEFNMALLKLHKNMTFGKEEPRIDMIEFSRDQVVPVDQKVLFLGWGSVLGSGGSGGQVLLQKLELPVYDLADCQDIYGRELVTRHNFCAGYITIHKNVCNHDAGGPAVMNGRLVGILSFSSKRCDELDQPAVFSKVGPLAPWLDTLGDKRFRLRNVGIKTLI